MSLWKIGQLARRTGLSVRTLHHYDDLGLLRPAQRSDAGYRLYGEADVARLQQIMSLRALGFPLAEIKTLLDRADVSLRQVIALHIEQLKAQLELQRDLYRRLEAIASHLDRTEATSVDDLFHTMEVMTTMDRMETYYTPEQLATLRQRREELGEDEIARVEAEWPELIAQVRAAMECGTDPADERVQQLAGRWRALVEAFTSGDAGIAQSLQTMYRSEPEIGSRFGLDPALFAYIGKAMAVTSGTSQGESE